MATPLEQEFHTRMQRIHELAAAECNYRPQRFRQMVEEIGGLPAARRLLRSSEHPEGLTRLWECGRLDISMEALVLQEPWRALFTEDELGTARRRLEDLEHPAG